MRETFQSQSQITHKSRLDLIHACRCVETPSLIFPYSMHTSKFPFTLTTCQFTAAAYRKTCPIVLCVLCPTCPIVLSPVHCTNL